MIKFSIIKYFKFPQLLSRSGIEKGFCDACGNYATFESSEVITSELADAWDISPSIKQAFNRRESMYCSYCHNSFRTRKLAGAILKLYGSSRINSLKQLVGHKSFRNLIIAEINGCGNLHPILEELPNIHYSEYQTVHKIKSVRNENLESLTYKDDFFDLVLTSETLEHIPNISKAVAEIYRVLKPGGYHVFTIPLITSRISRDRVRIHDDGRLVKILPDSFHGIDKNEDYIVFREFGWDTTRLFERIGFKVRIYFFNILKDDYSSVFVTQKI